jgi:hypothetical protein
MYADPNLGSNIGIQTRFKPGNPGGGRPVGTGQAALRAKLEQYLNLDTAVILPDGTKDKRAVIDATVLALLHKATRGDIPAIKELFDRHYGKLSDKVELTGKDGGAIQVNHTAHLEQLYGGMIDAFEVKAVKIE